MKIIQADEIGYCKGVKKAMGETLAALSRSRRSGKRVFGHGELIHNKAAMDLLRSKGLLLYDENIPVEPGDAVIVRAHGLPPEELRKLAERGLEVIDATCPMVRGIQKLVRGEAEKGKNVLIWGTKGHPEVEGLLGHSLGMGVAAGEAEEVAGLPDWERVVMVAQTTQDAGKFEEFKKAAKEKFGERVEIKNTICAATVKRQNDVSKLAGLVSSMVVVGGKTSGNTKRLAELAKREGILAVTVEGPEDIPPDFDLDVPVVGIAGGASTPVWQIRMVERELLDRSGGKGDATPAVIVRKILRALVLSYVFVGLGTAAISFAMAAALGFAYPFPALILFFFFGLGMSLLNGFSTRDSAKFNDPDRAVFLVKHVKFLSILGLSCVPLALVAAWTVDFKVFLFAVAHGLFGLFCSLAPLGRLKALRARGIGGIRDFPFGKIFPVTVGLSLLAILPAYLTDPPLLSLDFSGLAKGVVGFSLLALRVFVRTLLTDMADDRGDRIFGMASPAGILGEKKSARLLEILAALWGALLVFAYLAGILNGFAAVLFATGPLYNAFLLRAFLAGNFGRGYLFDLLLDAQFPVAGLCVLAWGLFA
ncbi:MAG: 4-hydroxy-3-methylbut-2-enyl diphosphate reductase [Deltaproteobacteria bacterium]|jgi:4-hydroxy-3-methylbut-2-enyl diphosphate reductase|nr:4-hydroxy-3-methylbut-2-enyl diphosphate reductase [Deltaproteobacteria bacterium]